MDTVDPGDGHPRRGLSIHGGREIAVEFGSNTLGVERWVADISARPLNADGTLQAVTAPESWFRPRRHIIGTGQTQSPKFILDAGGEAPGGWRWNIAIPPQGTAP